MYVEDLSVMREQMLKIEFRNIELEESNTRLSRDFEELQVRNRELESQIRQITAEDDEEAFEQSSSMVDGRTTEILDLHRRLSQERWSSLKLKEKIREQEEMIKELNAVQERYIEEVNDHQILNSEIAIHKKTIADYQRHQLLQGGNIEDTKDDTLLFYEN